MIQLFQKLKNPENAKDVSNNEKAIMVASLLIECAKSDDDFSSNEKEMIIKILKNKLQHDDEEAQDCFSKSNALSNESVEVYSLTKEIRDNFSKDETLLIFTFLWQIILADGIVDDFESSLMSKLTGLFHLTGKENAEARERAKHLLDH